MTLDRLSLPGNRATWWVLGTLAVLLPFGLLIGHGAPSDETAMGTLRFQVRLRNVMWRMTQIGEVALREHDRRGGGARAEPADDDVAGTSESAAKPAQKLAGDATSLPKTDAPKTDAPKAEANTNAEADDERRPRLRETPATLQRLAAGREVMEKAIVTLFDHTTTAAGQELVVAHAIAVDAGATATRLASRLQSPSDAIRAALAATAANRGESPPSPLAMAVTPAHAVVSRSDFGDGWGPFIRERVRARVHALAGDRSGARRANAALSWSDETLLPLLYTLLQGLLMAGVFGTGIWFFGALRVSAARKQGAAPLNWLRARHVGLGDERPYIDDRLVPLLGFGAWLMVYLLAGALIRTLPGPRDAVGFHVLFQSLSGAVFAAWVVSSFSRTALPLDAARLRPAASGVSPWRASTAALWTYCAVLPPMLVLAFVNMLIAELVGLSDAAPHPVVGMLLEDGDPMQLGALAVAVVIGAPLGEELIFRAFLYRALKQHTRVLVAAVISGVIFSLVHMSPAAFLPYMTLGIAFALVFEWTGSLWASIILHGLWNAVVFGCMAVITLS